MHTLNTSRAFVLGVGAAFTLAGCASFSEIATQDGNGDYHLAVTGVSYTMSLSELTDAGHEKAGAYCAAQDKDMQLRWQARGWRPMEVELSFRCLARQTDQPGHPDLPDSSDSPSSLAALR